MANAINKVIRKIRHKHKPIQRKEKPWEKMVAEAKGRALKREAWERDKKIRRDAAFAKALLVRNSNLKKQREERAAEEARQLAITEARLKSLKKARRRLRWIRKQES